MSSSLSAEALARRFALSGEAAEAIFLRLQSAGIVSAPNAMGVAQVTRAFARPPVVPRPVESIAKRLKDLAQDAPEADAAEHPAETGDCPPEHDEAASPGNGNA